VDLKARSAFLLAACALSAVWGCGGKLLVDQNGAGGAPSIAGSNLKGGAGASSNAPRAGSDTGGIDAGGVGQRGGAPSQAGSNELAGGAPTNAAGGAFNPGGAPSAAGAAGATDVAGAGGAPELGAAGNAGAGNAGESGADTCKDFHQDGDESDADCGGSCAPCAQDKSCKQNSDCASDACDAISSTCAADPCIDHHQDGSESDIDCGGILGNCARCHAGKACRRNSDCQAGHPCSTVEPLVCL
jgi:hypothetical protein